MTENHMSVPLIPQTETALDNLAQVTGITNRADLINRAIQVYNLIATAQDEGKEVYLHDPDRKQHVIHRGGGQSTSNADEVWQLLEIQ